MSSLSPGVCKQNTHLPTMLGGSKFCFRWVAQPDNFHCVFCESQGGGGVSARRGFFSPGCTRRRRRAAGMGLGAPLSRLSAGPALPGATWSSLQPQPSRSQAVGCGHGCGGAAQSRPRLEVCRRQSLRCWQLGGDRPQGWRLRPQEMLGGGTRANGQKAAQDSRRLGAVPPSTPIQEGLGPGGRAAADHRGHLP